MLSCTSTMFRTLSDISLPEAHGGVLLICCRSTVLCAELAASRCASLASNVGDFLGGSATGNSNLNTPVSLIRGRISGPTVLVGEMLLETGACGDFNDCSDCLVSETATTLSTVFTPPVALKGNKVCCVTFCTCSEVCVLAIEATTTGDDFALPAGIDDGADPKFCACTVEDCAPATAATLAGALVALLPISGDAPVGEFLFIEVVSVLPLHETGGLRKLRPPF